MQWFLDPTNSYRSITLLASIGLLISSAQFLCLTPHFRESRLFGWDIIQTTYFRKPGGPTRLVLNVLLGANGLVALLLVRVGCLIALLVLPDHCFTLTLGILTAVVVLLVLEGLRFPFGLDGSDQMMLVIFAALCLRKLVHTPVADGLCLWFITGQACLAYFASGVSKLASRSWRNGTAVFGVFNTRSFGFSALAHALHNRPLLNRGIAWSVIGFELLFPVVLFGNAIVLWVVLAAGFGMHVLCALVMKLDSFVWAFLACYPAIVFCANEVHQNTSF
jgi:hypothetical protein